MRGHAATLGECGVHNAVHDGNKEQDDEGVEDVEDGGRQIVAIHRDVHYCGLEEQGCAHLEER